MWLLEAKSEHTCSKKYMGEGDGHTCSVGLYAPLSVTLEQRLLGGV